MSAVPTGYKQTEVGMIPEDWGVSTIASVCIAVLDCHHSTPIWTRAGAVVIRNQNIRDGKLDLSNASFTDERHFIERTRRAVPTVGDLVITREAPMGLVCLIPTGLRCCLGQRMVLLRPNQNSVKSGYLVYCLQGTEFQSAIAAGGGAGSTVSNLRIPVLKSLRIPIPTPPEQRAVAAALSDVDALLAKLEQLIAKKRDLKQAALQQLLTGQTRLAGFEKSKSYKKTEVGMIPEDWDVKALPEVSWFQEGPGLRNWQFTRSGMKVINVTNLKDGVLNLERTDRHISNAEFTKMYRHFAVDAEDIVMASSGNSYSKTAVVRKQDLPLVMNTSVVRFKPLVSYDYSFLWAILNSPLFKDQIDLLITGGAQPNFGPYHLKRVIVPVPPLPEQTAIATVLSDMDAELAALEARRDKTRALKQGMMQELLSGRIRLV